jgi:hypothetical protein
MCFVFCEVSSVTETVHEESVFPYSITPNPHIHVLVQAHYSSHLFTITKQILRHCFVILCITIGLVSHPSYTFAYDHMMS